MHSQKTVSENISKNESLFLSNIKNKIFLSQENKSTLNYWIDQMSNMLILHFQKWKCPFLKKMKMLIKKYIKHFHFCYQICLLCVCVHEPKHIKSSWELKNQKKELKTED